MSYLELRKLSKSFGKVVAVDDFELSVEAREFVALLGPSGCGKTTTLRMIAGFANPDSGEVWIRDQNVTNLPPSRRNVGLVFQNYALFPHMTVRANIGFGLKCHRVGKTLLDEQVASVLDLVDLPTHADHYPDELSGGQQQRVALARVLALKPDLLLFDEPLSNLDAKLRIQMRYEIRRLQREVGVTALLVTHDQEEAMTMADRIVVLNRGRIEQIGTPSEIYDRPRTRFVAEFIGTSNVLEGAVVAEGGCKVFRCKSGLNIEMGVIGAQFDKGFIAIRPEKIEFVQTGTPGSLHGTIRQVTHLGAAIEYVVQFKSGDTMIIQEQRRPGVVLRQDHDEVDVRWLPVNTILLSS
jgi:putative spermidine/putrescine transport system ATP-binding protein